MSRRPKPEPSAEKTSWERAGGEQGVRAITTALVGRMHADPMIGFFFRKTQLTRLAELEFQHASSHLGGPVSYTGRALDKAHGRLAIGQGHFLRRRMILAELLVAHDVPPTVARQWLSAQDEVVGQIVGPASGCPTEGLGSERPD